MGQREADIQHDRISRHVRAGGMRAWAQKQALTRDRSPEVANLPHTFRSALSDLHEDGFILVNLYWQARGRFNWESAAGLRQVP